MIFDVITEFSSRPERLQSAGKGLLDGMSREESKWFVQFHTHSSFLCFFKTDTAFLGDIRLERMKEELKSAKLQIEQEMATRKQVELKMESMKIAVASGGGGGTSIKSSLSTDESGTSCFLFSLLLSSPLISCCFSPSPLLVVYCILEEKVKGPDMLEASEFKDLIRSILEPKKFDVIFPTGMQRE